MDDEDIYLGNKAWHDANLVDEMNDVKTETKPTCPDYRAWLVKRLVNADPQVTADFREMYLTDALIPEKFKGPLAVPTILSLKAEVQDEVDYGAGVMALAKKEGLSITPSLDGITHINTYSKAATKLGRALSNLAPIGFTHPTEGKIASVEGFYYYLATGRAHSYLKDLSGHKAKEEGRKYDRVHSDDFVEQVKAAVTCKIVQNEKLKQAFINSTLPFAHYYYYGDKTNPKVIPLEKFSWLVDHLNELRERLSKGT